MSTSFYRTEKCFRRYEHIIAHALEKYPESIRFGSKAREATTDASRCRDAITSYKTNRWETSYSIFATFDEKPLKIWIDRNMAVIGAKEDEAKVELIQSVDDFGQLRVFNATPHTREQVAKLISFLNEGVLNIPLLFEHKWQGVIAEESAGLLNVSVRAESEGVIVF
jgi:hypothetical protein